MQRLAVYAAVLMLMVSVATPVFAGAGAAPAPEIDGSSLSAGLGLLTGGALLLRARLGRK